MIRLLSLFLATALGLSGDTPVQRELLRLELPRGWEEQPLRNDATTFIDLSGRPPPRSARFSAGSKHAGIVISAMEIPRRDFDPDVYLRWSPVSSATVVRETTFSEWAGRKGHGIERLVRHDYAGTVIFNAQRRFAFHENGIGCFFLAQQSNQDRRVAERGLERGAADLRAILLSLQLGTPK